MPWSDNPRGSVTEEEGTRSRRADYSGDSDGLREDGNEGNLVWAERQCGVGYIHDNV